MTNMIAAPAPTTHAFAAPLSSVTPTTTSSTPASRNRGHQRVRSVRTKRAALGRAGLPTRTMGNPSAPGTGGTAGAVGTSGRSSSRRRCDTPSLAASVLRPMELLSSAPLDRASYQGGGMCDSWAAGRRAGDRADPERNHEGPGSTSIAVALSQPSLLPVRRPRGGETEGSTGAVKHPFAEQPAGMWRWDEDHAQIERRRPGSEPGQDAVPVARMWHETGAGPRPGRQPRPGNVP